MDSHSHRPPAAARDSPKPRKAPRQARSRHTVDAILDAAARVFAQEGYAATTTNRVAEVAGVSIGSLYQYFPNKDALIVALHHRHSAQMRAVMTTVLDASSGASLRDSLAALVRALLAAHLIEPRLHRMLEREFSFFDDAHEESGAHAVVIGRVTALLERHRADLAVDDVALATWTVMRALESLVHAAILEPPRAPLPAVEDAIVDLLVGYLAGPRQPPTQPTRHPARPSPLQPR